MSWSSPVRLLGVCGLLALSTACGGNPSVSGGKHGTDGGTSSGGKSSDDGTSGSINIHTGGADDGDDTGGATSQGTFECGNAELEPGELCDDGNTSDDDGCSGDCTETDLDYDCSKLGEPCVKVVVCGDGVLQGEEKCDDKNTTDGDGCSGDCGLVEVGFQCVRPGEVCVKTAVCGNGVRERGEGCDDAQATPVAGDGCDASCQLEDENKFSCSPGKACVPIVCGDGKRTPNEECDDSNPTDNDGCSHDCKVETGYTCGTNGCRGVCGDGTVVTGEECDDGARVGGDGCSSACTVEPFFGCTGSPSVCASNIACGNNKIEPGEVCDPPGKDGCKAGCKSFTLQTKLPVCNNGIVEDGEGCEPANVGNGCSATCQVEGGWSCPQPGFCFKNPTCGDGTVDFALGEACDPPQVGMGCSALCKEEANWHCSGLKNSVCEKPDCGNGAVEFGEQCDDAAFGVGCTNCKLDAGYACPSPGQPCVAKCGDGVKVGGEQCDDKNQVDGDGCNKGCKIEVGFSCPTVGVTCIPSICGDNKVDVGEGCDDGGVCVGGANAGKACKLTKTGTVTSPDCPTGECHLVAGDTCGPTCQAEPTVTKGPSPVVNVFCGDGLITGADECDDGNNIAGDGCEVDNASMDKHCVVTDGFSCANKLTLPPSLDISVTYRDFRSAEAPGGHPDFMYNDLGHVAEITGGVCTANEGSLTTSAGDKVKCGRLDANGVPELVKTDTATTGINSADSFSMWYRDGNPPQPVVGNPPVITGFHGNIETKTIKSTMGKPITLPLAQVGTGNVYVFPADPNASGDNFFPLNGNPNILAGDKFENVYAEGNTCGTKGGVKNHVDAGCYCENGGCPDKNFSFTTELRYFFQYKGGERLTFRGDDDVWVYVNGRVAVDIGGLHSRKYGQVVLGDDGSGAGGVDSNCSAHSQDGAPPDPATCYTQGEKDDNTDSRFGLTVGGVYEIVLFQAERHVNESNFKLTLANFLAPRSQCDPICGDSMVVGDEACDDGSANNSNTKAGACNTSCTGRNFCGDTVTQSTAGPKPAESCDDGSNLTLYKNPPLNGACAPGCKLPASCGDGDVQAGQGEQCDLGTANNTGAYGGCTAQCKLGGYCGDGVPNGTEACDKGAQNGKQYGVDSCGYDCKQGPHCGDGIPNDDSEECDKGSANGQAGSGCTAACKTVPGCGDGQLQSNLGEQCDYGQFASNTAYGGCTNLCMFGPHCGDGDTASMYEECDDGANNSDATYDGCTSKCAKGPHCGDGTLQMSSGEMCDNGFNDDDYMLSSKSCGADCELPPSCGDGKLQSNYELCDEGAKNSDSAYGGCTTKCVFGSYCGDGDVQGPEMCDDGADNVAYASKKGGCSYDCQMAPYCGDGERNGPEQCDLGDGKNTGDYGTCNADCSFAARCGDKVKNGNEDCDDGPGGSLTCSALCKRRTVVQ